MPRSYIDPEDRGKNHPRNRRPNDQAILVYVPIHIHHLFKTKCEKRKQKMSHVIIALIQAWLADPSIIPVDVSRPRRPPRANANKGS